jgi:hypothetical protein
MDSRHAPPLHLIRLDRGEDVLAALTGYAAEHGIGAGTIQGIGAVEDVVIGAYSSESWAYSKVALEGEWELLSFQATVALLDGEPFVHPHVVLGDAGGRVRGGHLFEARVAVTGEFTLLSADVRVTREMDERVGLKLWRFGG